jgi:hypothetical protein
MMRLAIDNTNRRTADDNAPQRSWSRREQRSEAAQLTTVAEDAVTSRIITGGSNENRKRRIALESKTPAGPGYGGGVGKDGARQAGLGVAPRTHEEINSDDRVPARRFYGQREKCVPLSRG